jgi:hypothetical protein
MKQLAASTTATGRTLILKAKGFLESECGAKVIYGDSVMPYTPITAEVNGVVRVPRGGFGVAQEQIGALPEKHDGLRGKVGELHPNTGRRLARANRLLGRRDRRSSPKYARHASSIESPSQRVD